MAVGEQVLAEMAAEEAGAAGDEDAFAQSVGHIRFCLGYAPHRLWPLVKPRSMQHLIKAACI